MSTDPRIFLPPMPYGGVLLPNTAPPLVPKSGVAVNELLYDFDFSQPLDPKVWLQTLPWDAAHNPPGNVSQDGTSLNLTYRGNGVGAMVCSFPFGAVQGLMIGPYRVYVEFDADVPDATWFALYLSPVKLGLEIDSIEFLQNLDTSNEHYWSGGVATSSHLSGQLGPLPVGRHAFGTAIGDNAYSEYWDSKEVITNYPVAPGSDGLCMFMGLGQGQQDTDTPGTIMRVYGIRVWSL